MSEHGDHSDEMTTAGMLDDEAVEAFFAGAAHSGWQRHEALVRLAEDVSVATSGPPPAPGPALQEFMAGRSSRPSTAPDEPVQLATWGRRPVAWAPRPVPMVPRPSSSPRDHPGARWAVRAAAVAVTALSGVSAAAAAGVLPDPAQRVVANAVEAVTPFELPEPGPSRPATAPPPAAPLPTASGAPAVGPAAVPSDVTTGEVADPGAPVAPAPPPEQPAPQPTVAPPPPSNGTAGTWPCQTTTRSAPSGAWSGQSTADQQTTWSSGGGGYGDSSGLWGTSGTTQCWSFNDWASWWGSGDGGGDGHRSQKKGWTLSRPDR